MDWSADEALEQERTRGVKIASDGCGDWHPAHHMTRGGLAGLSLTWKSGIAEMVQGQPAKVSSCELPNSKAARISAVEERGEADGGGGKQTSGHS